MPKPPKVKPNYPCAICGTASTVVDSRGRIEGVYRRRVCLNPRCEHRWSTVEKESAQALSDDMATDVMIKVNDFRAGMRAVGVEVARVLKRLDDLENMLLGGRPRRKKTPRLTPFPKAEPQ